MKEGVKKKKISPIVFVAILVGGILLIAAAVFGVISLIHYNQENNFYDGSLLPISDSCKKIGVNPTSADCSNPSSCIITLKRIGTNKMEMEGVYLVLRNSTDVSRLIPIKISIEPSSSKTVTIDLNNIASWDINGTPVNTTLTSPNEVESNVYQLDSNGNRQICYYTGKFNF